MPEILINSPLLTFSWANPKLRLRQSEIGGLGVFASDFISKSETCVLFGGYVIPAKDEPEDQDYGLQITEDLVLISTMWKNHELTDFINHSCNPNLGFKGQIALVAMRDIFNDEEITFDYAMCLHNSYGCKPYCMDCKCGSINCRGKITDNDWMNSELQIRYNGYFQWFLQEKIERQLLASTPNLNQ